MRNIKILFVEDSEEDALLLQREINRAGFEVASLRVETAKDMRSALDTSEWDLIISDGVLPHFNAADALKIVAETGKYIPFIIVSGRIDEESAVVAMRSGAHDYINKNDLKRLVPAVERELAEASERKMRRRMELSVQKSESRYRMLFEKMMDAFLLHTDVHDNDSEVADFMIIDVNRAYVDITGISRENLIGKTMREIDPTITDEVINRYTKVMTTGDADHFVYHSGTFDKFFEVSVYRPREGLVATVLRDVSFIKITAERQELFNSILQTLNREDDTRVILQEILGLLKHHYRFDLVAMRLRHGDEFPYYLHEGFSENFIGPHSIPEAENECGKIPRDVGRASRFDCLCGLVINGLNGSTESFLTKGGSFWTNSLSELLSAKMEGLSILKIRENCLKEGYESMALIPLRYGDDTIGLLQFNDRKKNRFSHDMIGFLESMGFTVGIALKRRGIEEKTRKSEERYRTILDEIEEGYYEVDLSGNFIFFNDALCRIYGYARDVLMGLNNRDYMSRETSKSVSKIFIEVLRTGKPNKVFDYEFIKKDGSKIIVEISVSLIRDADGKAIGYRGIVRDVSERKRAEAALKESENRYRAIFDGSLNLVYLHDMEGRFVEANETALQLFGYNREDLSSLSINDLLSPDQQQRAFGQIANFISKNAKSEITEYQLRTKQGGTVFVEITASPLYREGRPYAVLGVARDVTERKLNEERILASLREKEALLKEIHHRVKNNLQVISSLIGLQSAHIREGQEVQGALADMQNRIKSMAIVHEKLYRSENFEGIDFGEYIAGMIESISKSMLSADRGIRILTGTEPVILGIDSAIPCGLILNELITNAAKHAFPEGRTGHITAGIREEEGGLVSIFVSDNGVGLPADFDPDSGSTLGIRLVQILTKQLGGTLSIATGSGTEFRVTFKNEKRE